MNELYLSFPEDLKCEMCQIISKKLNEDPEFGTCVKLKDLKISIKAILDYKNGDEVLPFLVFMD